MRPSWVGPCHMSCDTCMVCNYTGQKATTQCKAQKNKQNWSSWLLTEPASGHRMPTASREVSSRRMHRLPHSSSSNRQGE